MDWHRVNTNLDSIKILIVDDSAVLRGLVARLFEKEPGMEVKGTASNGEIALSMLKSNPVDLVILDLEMPVMDGLTVLPLILKQHSGMNSSQKPGGWSPLSHAAPAPADRAAEPQSWTSCCGWSVTVY